MTSRGVALVRRALPRRTALSALFGGLPGLLLAAGIDEAAAKNKKGKNQRRRRKKRPCGIGDKPGKECRCKKQGDACTADANCCPGTQPLSCQTGTCQPCDVCQEGCAFSSAQAAIDAAAPGDVIRLCAGSFAGPLTIAKDVILIGVGNGTGGTMLDGQGVDRTVRVAENTVTLRRLRITGGKANGDGDGGGISGQGSELTLTECTVSGNVAAFGGGIFIAGGRLTLNDSSVRDNEAADAGGGIFVSLTRLTLNDSRVEGNRAAEVGGGIFLGGGSTVTLIESVVRGNTPDNCVGNGCG